jgi:hypothetical protein
MPMPRPADKETQSDFIERFMSDDLMKKEYPDEKQRAGIAYSQWKEYGKMGERGGDRGGLKQRPLRESESLMVCKERITVDQKGKEWEITIIQGGTSINGFHYDHELLKESANIFEGVDVYAQKFGDTLDHRPGEDTNPNGLILNKIGWVENVRYKSDGNGRLVGSFKVVNSTLADMLKNTWELDKSRMPEFSIDVIGNGYVKEGIKYVTEFKKVNSLDMVSNASAGGQFERMVASINIKQGENMDKIIEMLLNKVKEGSIKLKESIEGKNDKEISAMIKEALAVEKEDKVKEAVTKEMLEQIKSLPTIEAIKEAMSEMLKNSEKSDEDEDEKSEEKSEDKEESKEDESKDEDVKEAVNKMQKELDRIKGEKVLEEILAKESVLDNASKNRIRKYFDGRTFTADEVNKEVSGLKKYLESLGAEKKLNIIESAESVSVGDTKKDRLTKLLELYINPSLEGTEGYEDITHNMMFRSLQEAVSAFAGHSHFEGIGTIKEATTSSFPTIFQDVMNKQLRKQYDIMYTEAAWRKFVEEVSIETLDEQHIYDLGGFSAISTVSENGTYQALTAPSDIEATYTPSKYGNLFTITEEMLYTSGDKVTQLIRSIPNNMVASAKATLAKFVFDRVTGCDGSGGVNQLTIYDSTALYTSSHGNLSTSALSYANFYSGYTAMANQTKLSSVYPAEIRPRWLLVPYELMPTASLVVGTPNYPSQTSNGVPLTNPYAALGVEVVAVPQYYLCSDTNNWYLIGDKNTHPTLQVGYFQNKRAPELLLQNQPNVAGVFTADQWTYKVKWRFGGAITDYRTFYGGIVAGGGTA